MHIVNIYLWNTTDFNRKKYKLFVSTVHDRQSFFNRDGTLTKYIIITNNVHRKFSYEQVILNYLTNNSSNVNELLPWFETNGGK